jgi:hypothetical protein
MVSGGLLYAASWQRWAGVCPWGGNQETRACETRMDHLYDFLPPSAPWLPAGVAAQLAGVSLLVLAVALISLPWALTGHRPGLRPAVALLATGLAVIDVGLATVRSGLRGTVVGPVAGDVSLWVWALAPALLYGCLALQARGWARGAAVLLILASPPIAFFYALGPFDAQQWWEAISGLLTAGAGACVLVEAVRRPTRRTEAIDESAVGVTRC